LTVVRDLLTDSGSVFVQIGDENVHLLRSVLDEIFQPENFVSLITVRKTGAVSSPDARLNSLGTISDYIVWYAKRKEVLKYRQLFSRKADTSTGDQYRLDGKAAHASEAAILHDATRDSLMKTMGLTVLRIPAKTVFKDPEGAYRAIKNAVDEAYTAKETEWIEASRIRKNDAIFFGTELTGVHVTEIHEQITEEPVYDLEVEDAHSFVTEVCAVHNCGSGTTAYVAEQWGRRWITIDTSRVSLALARSRIMGARYPYYLLADSPDGQQKESLLTQKAPSTAPTHGNIRQGFVYERVPHITLKSIANNTEIDVIWEKFQQKLEPIREKLNAALKKKWEEWEIGSAYLHKRKRHKIRSHVYAGP